MKWQKEFVCKHQLFLCILLYNTFRFGCSTQVTSLHDIMQLNLLSLFCFSEYTYIIELMMVANVTYLH